MADVSAIGLSVTIKASNTFPGGFQINRFSDDSDPVDFPLATLAEMGMDVNGNLVSWSAPAPQNVTISVLPGTDEDDNLQVLLQANRSAKGRTVARDVITLVVGYGDGSSTTCREGIIVGGPAAKSAASAGRMKSHTYTFAFQDFDHTRAATA